MLFGSRWISLDLVGSRWLIRSRGRAPSPAQAAQAARSNTWSCPEATPENTFQICSNHFNIFQLRRPEIWKINEGQPSNLDPCFTICRSPSAKLMISPIEPLKTFLPFTALRMRSRIYLLRLLRSTFDILKHPGRILKHDVFLDSGWTSLPGELCPPEGGCPRDHGYRCRQQ